MSIANWMWHSRYLVTFAVDICSLVNWQPFRAVAVAIHSALCSLNSWRKEKDSDFHTKDWQTDWGGHTLWSDWMDSTKALLLDMMMRRCRHSLDSRVERIKLNFAGLWFKLGYHSFMSLMVLVVGHGGVFVAEWLSRVPFLGPTKQLIWWHCAVMG